jgi:hypothetical protein
LRALEDRVAVPASALAPPACSIPKAGTTAGPWGAAHYKNILG